MTSSTPDRTDLIEGTEGTEGTGGTGGTDRTDDDRDSGHRLPDAGDAILPFRIDVPDAVLDDLRDRLARTRWPEPVPGTGWDAGTDTAYLRELCAYWRDEYDWRRHEAELNAYPNHLTEIDGQRIHFVHARSADPDALPLVLSHGWPGSVAEFAKVLGPLTAPGPDAFHVVCPSLPGYGWSSPVREAGWGPVRMARAFAELMRRLGYERYGAQGGDWGSIVSTELARAEPERVVGLHVNLLIAGPGPDDDPAGFTAAERASLARMQEVGRTEAGYLRQQATKPYTLGHGLVDSPAGLASWIVEKFRGWSDCGGDVERSFTRDELLTNITLYWVTATAHSAARIYYENAQAVAAAGPGAAARVEVPTGHAHFPGEQLGTPSRRWAERLYNVAHWTEMPSGGHFAAMEEPELLVEDIRAFFRPLRAAARR
ncbi:epoxide hydrolase family protein [Yinghuangia soli]|uniref:Epoxide hydrolase n=1 Tax=Yinghuangia soli TaxID=2908204 RepID=A0AA41Q683_9ACTN|nr:epoxide hydrolase family protein [Yinghuangia soli]MCF2532345.1 epoxide hydrolase [Yinghuangia soli]